MVYIDNREYEVTAVTPNRVYLEDTFNGAERDISRDEFEAMRVSGEIEVK